MFKSDSACARDDELRKFGDRQGEQKAAEEALSGRVHERVGREKGGGYSETVRRAPKRRRRN